MSIEAMKLALEALIVADKRIIAGGLASDARLQMKKAIAAIRQAIEQAEKQEYSKRHNCPHCEREFACNHHEWVGVTGDEIDDIAAESGFGYINVARAIEAKLKEKNT